MLKEIMRAAVDPSFPRETTQALCFGQQWVLLLVICIWTELLLVCEASGLTNIELCLHPVYRKQ